MSVNTTLELLNQLPSSNLTPTANWPGSTTAWGVPQLSIDWRQAYGASAISGMAQDGAGNAVVIGSESPVRHGLMPYSRAAAWVSKIDANGNALWSSRWEYLHGPTQSAQITITDTAIDGFGTENNLVNSVDVFEYHQPNLTVVKLNTDGTQAWWQWSNIFSRIFGGLRTMENGQLISSFSDSESQLAIGDNGSIHVGHRNAIYADFGMDAWTAIMVEKFTADGTLLGAKTLAQSVAEAPKREGIIAGSGPANDFEFAMSSDAQGNLYIAGRFTDTVTFGAVHDPQQTLQLSSGAAASLGVAKFDVDGPLAWASQQSIGDWVPGVLLVDNLEKLTIGGMHRASMSDFAFGAAEGPLGGSLLPWRSITEVLQLLRKPVEIAIWPVIPPVEPLPL